MKGRRFALMAVAAAAALGASTPVHAMPPLLAAVATVAVEVLAIGGTFLGLTATTWIFVGSLAYGAYKAHEARADARRAYNRGLTDRTISLQGGEVPWQIIYGEATVAPAFAAILTSGERDEYKHVVTIWAAHECEGCVDVMLGGESIGPLDANGWVTTGKWAKTETTTASVTVTLNGSAQATLPHVPVQVFEAAYNFGGDSGFDFAVPTWTPGSAVVTVPGWEGRTVTLSYTRATSNSRVRVRHFTGSPDQLADPVLMGLLPAEWKASDRLRGLTYSIWSFDLREPELQQMPQMTARWRGKKLYDPRTGLTVWSPNNALAVRDFLLAEYGKRCAPEQVGDASVIASANACDEPLPEFDDAPRYTCNGVFRTDQDTDVTLRQLLQSMAGSATFSGVWRIQAGVYEPPVMDLTDADNAGSVEEIPAPPEAEVFNGLRGKFFSPDRYDQLTDYPPYANPAFVAEDGQALWGDLPLPFTNTSWRCHNIARIFTERSRGEQISYPAKKRALRLRPGQRVRLSNSYLGMTNAIFRVVKKDYQPGQAQVRLLLQQDDPSYWDTVDAPATLPPPADNNPDPFFVAPVAGLAVESGDTVAQRAADGTVLSRVRVTVAASQDALVTTGGALQLEYRPADETGWTRAPEAPGSTTQVWLQGLQDGRLYLVQARWRNAVGAVGDWRVASVIAAGDSTPPAAATAMTHEAIPGGARHRWARPTEADYSYSELRVGATWATAGPLFRGDATEATWTPPADGTYTLWLMYVDRSGNGSEPAPFAWPYTAVPVDGSQSAPVYLYQRTTTPTPPSGPAAALTYTFATGALSGTLGAWSADVPSSGGAYLYRVQALVVGLGPTEEIVPGEWGAARLMAVDGAAGPTGPAGPPGADGAPGTPGLQYASPTLWRWAASIPTITGSNTYVWATGAITGALPADWAATAGTGSPGQTLWAATVPLIGNAGDATASIAWSGASITPRGAAGADGSPGSPGAAGISARRAYALTTAASLGSGTVTSTGINSLPAAGSFGAASWSASPSTPAAGEVLYQSDGLYNPATNQITWETPYISALKVGQLSALAVNTGSLTANGNVTVTGEIFSNGFVAGSTGWRIRGNGTAEFNSIVARGGLYATYGEIAGAVITSTYVQSADYVPNTAGWRLSNSDGTLYANSALLRNADASRVFNLNASGSQVVFKAAGVEILATGASTWSGTMKIGSAPTLSGTTMTGTGVEATPSGTLAVGNSSSNMTFSPANGLRLNGATVSGGTITNPVMDTISASISATNNVGAGGNGTSRTATATITSASGGRSPYTYAWSVANIERYGAITGFDVSGVSSATFSVSGTGTNAIVMCDLVCVVTDANGRSITKTTGLTVQWGTPVIP